MVDLRMVPCPDERLRDDVSRKELSINERLGGSPATANACYATKITPARVKWPNFDLL